MQRAVKTLQPFEFRSDFTVADAPEPVIEPVEELGSEVTLHLEHQLTLHLVEVTIFGLPLDMPIWVDSRVLGRDRVIVGGGNRSSKVIIPPAELNKIPGLEFVEGLAVEPPAQ